MADLKIRVLADADQAKRVFRSVGDSTKVLYKDANGQLRDTQGRFAALDKSASRSGGVFKKLGAAAKVGLAGAVVGIGAASTAAVSFTKDAIDSASNLEQSTGAVEAVFGKQAAGIKKVAGEAAQSFGLSKNEYQELASVLGAGLKNKGLSDFGAETQKVIGLGADLAAQFGGSTREAVESVTSLMRGETDPIEKYGVSINQTAIAAELAARGQDKLKGKALEQAKAQAALSLLFRQTKDAQGAFARESDTLAGKQQRNAAAWENLKAKMGEVFLPVATKVQEVLAEKVLPVVERVFTWIGENAPGAIAAVKGFLDGLKGDGTATQYLDYIKTAFSTVLPIVQQLVGAIVAAWPQISAALGSVFSALQSVMTLVGQLWALFGPTILAQITNVIQTIVGVVGGAFQVIGGIVKTVSALLQGDWSGAWQGIQQIVAGSTQILLAVVRGLFTTLDNLTGGALTRVKDFWVNAWTSVKTFVSTSFTAIKTTVSAGVTSIKSVITAGLTVIKTTWTAGWNYLKTKLSEAWTAIKSKVTEGVSVVKTKISDLKAKITGVFSSAGTWLADAGRRIIGGLLSGIGERIGQVRDKLRTLTNLIPSWKGPKERDARLLFQAGKLIMQSLVRGFDAGESGIQAKLASVTRTIQNGLGDVPAPALSPVITPRLESPTGGALSLAAVGGPAVPTTVVESGAITIQAGVGDPVAIGKEVIRVMDAALSAGARRRAA